MRFLFENTFSVNFVWPRFGKFMEYQNLCSLKIMLVRFINIVQQAEEALRQAAASELWPSGHKQIPRDYIYSRSKDILAPLFWGQDNLFLLGWLGEIYIQLSRGGRTICPTGPIMVRQAGWREI